MKRETKLLKAFKEQREAPSLGRRIIIPAFTKIMKAPYKITFHSEHLEVLIGIGKDHTASLYMDVDAWNALKKGEKLSI